MTFCMGCGRNKGVFYKQQLIKEDHHIPNRDIGNLNTSFFIALALGRGAS